MLRAILLLFVALCYNTSIHAQYVETLISNTEIRDGLHVDPSGNIYTTSGGFAGFEIGLFDIETELFNPNFATGFFGPVDVDQYQDSLLIVSNYDNNTVTAHNLRTRQNRIIASGLDGPSGITIDDNDNIYVASWGNAPAYAGRQIHKITPSGQVIEYINSPVLYRPQAMTIGVDGALIAHSNGNLYRANPSDSTLQFWVGIGQTVGHMAFRKQDNCVYATSDNRIYKITPNGEITLVAGGISGYQDGDLQSARFRALLGIHFSPTEDTLYVCDSGYGQNIGRLRAIVLNPVVSNLHNHHHEDINIFPNPSQNYITINFPNQTPTSIKVFDIKGLLLIEKVGVQNSIQININDLPPGTYSVQIENSTKSVIKRFIKY